MYNSYNSLRDEIQHQIENQKSVLNKFPENLSRPITQSCSKHLAQFTSFERQKTNDHQTTNTTNDNRRDGQSKITLSHQIAQFQDKHESSNKNETSTKTENTNESKAPQQSTSQSSMNLLETIVHVDWALENLMYGLTLSLEHHEIIKDCLNIYQDWLSILTDKPNSFIPQPIRDNPVIYSRKMLWHLYHLFVPRRDTKDIMGHIRMCHTVLKLIEVIAIDSNPLKKELWEDFLKFFLAINDVVLAPPFNEHDFTKNLSARIVATLFEIWLIACKENFPSPSLWKTFQEMCANWRHHISLVEEWNRTCFTLTNRMLELIWWPESTNYMKYVTASHKNVANDIQKIINSMPTETVIQTWFRFMHIIGKPIDFTDVKSITKTPQFMRHGYMQKVSGDSNVDLLLNTNFECVEKLNRIFLEMIKGISRLVDSFLGINLNYNGTSFNNVYTSPTNNKLSYTNLPSKIKSKDLLLKLK
jgi:hypothetical protein